MKKTAWVIFLYATLVLAGGLTGYIRSGSNPSLISGVVFGILLFISAFLMLKKNIYGYFSSFFLALILEGVFTWRFAKSLKFFPGGLLSLISLVVLIIVGCKIGRRLRTSR
jgi:uncharacterized membrane protein (UPF0136 family)